MKSLRKTLKYAFAILLLLAAGAGAIGVWWWQHSDEWLREVVLKKFAEDAPGWNISVDRCRFDFVRTVYIDGFAISGDGKSGVISSVPKIQVVVDRESLADQRKVVVHKIRVSNPHLNLVQLSDGSWNLLNLPPLKPSNQALPEWEISNGSIAVQVQHPNGDKPEAVLVSNLEMNLIPSGKRQFLVDGHGTIGGLGKVELNGRWEVDPKTWSINTTLPNVQINSALLEKLSMLSPQFGEALAKTEQTIDQRSKQELHGNPQHDPFLTQNRAAGSKNPSLNIDAVSDINLRLTRWQTDAVVEYKFLMNLHRGQIQHSSFPYLADGITGKIYADNRDVLIRDMTMHEGATRLSLNARFRHHANANNGRVELSVSHLPCDARFRGQLPEKLKQTYDLVQPEGNINASVNLRRNGDGSWAYGNLVVSTQDAHVLHKKFPYPVSKVSGTARQDGEKLFLEFQGIAGTRPVTLKGVLNNIGPGSAAQFDLRVDSIPIDDTLLTAAPDGLEKTIRDLELTGLSDVFARFTRPAGVNKTFQTDLVANIRNATVRYKQFPYRVQNVSGTATAIGNEWRFTKLQGTHDTGTLRGEGTFSKRNGVGELALEVAAENLPLDESLRLAIPDRWKSTWQRVAPAGQADLNASVRWREGEPAVVSLPSLRVREGQMRLEDFPYPMRRIEARLAIDETGFNLHSFSGWHDDTEISAKGFFQNVGEKQWRLRLTELDARNLVSDRSLLRALPVHLRSVASCIDSEHPFNLDGMVEFRGLHNSDAVPTAAWDVRTTFQDGLVHCGLDYAKLNGEMTTRGTWDGSNVVLGGQLNLKRATILGYDFTEVRGPIELRDGVLVLGSRKALDPKQKEGATPSIPLEERITARAIEGLFTADVAAELGETPVYDGVLSMSNAKLEEYARLYLEDDSDLRGVMNGWLVLHGMGAEDENLFGRGQLQISPAALYELPVFAQMFNVLRLAPTDNTAFNYALFDFRLGERKFTFNSIDLVGSTFSMRGRGVADFDKNLSLDFYSMLPRTQIPIPLLSQFVDQATKAWVGVEVRGKVDTPIAKTKAVPNLDGALKQFLTAVEKGPGRGFPALPPFIPQGPPQSRTPTPPRR